MGCDTTGDALAQRVRSEYREMPGLQLTAPQAARLLGLDRVRCARLLEQLISEGFLRLGRRGQYVRADGR